MTDEDWGKEYARCLGVYLAGAAIERIDRRGRGVRDANFLVLINAYHEAIPFTLSQLLPTGRWRTLIDTAQENLESREYAAGEKFDLQGRSMALLIQTAAAVAVAT
jgi:glycogen operon protein